MTTDLVALNDAVALLAELTQRLPRGDADRKIGLVNLANALAARYTFRLEPTDLQRAIGAIEEALVTEPYNAVLLSTLSSRLYDHYQRISDPADLDKAIDAGERRLRSTRG